MRKALLCILIAVAPATAYRNLQSEPSAAPRYGYKVVRSFPHDRTAFTQGLEYRGGFLWEGTGLEGRSSIRKVELETGRVLQQQPLELPYFGEGITLMDQRLIQLTWMHGRGFVYDRNSFRRIDTFNYDGEGWGLTNDGERIYMSDGTAEIRVLDPSTLQELRRITVRDGRRPVAMLNELEYIRGEILANIWLTDQIVRISPEDGRVTGWIDMTGLLPPSDSAGADVLNGIAFDPLGGRIFVTGKLWPRLFEVEIIPAAR